MVGIWCKWLPPGDTGVGRWREDGGDLQGPEALGPRAGDGGLRPGPLNAPQNHKCDVAYRMCGLS